MGISERRLEDQEIAVLRLGTTRGLREHDAVLAAVRAVGRCQIEAHEEAYRHVGAGAARRERIAARLAALCGGGTTRVRIAVHERVAVAVRHVVTVRPEPEAWLRVLRVPSLVEERGRRNPADAARRDDLLQ